MTKLFKPDYSKKLYTISIDVYENAHQFCINSEINYSPGYQECIGIMEIVKTALLRDMQDINIKEAKKYFDNVPKTKKK